MLILLTRTAEPYEATDYYGHYKKEMKCLRDFYRLLQQMGFSFQSLEELKILNGTHELYTHRRQKMSIDYSDMAFPKPGKKKKRKIHKKSILNSQKGICYLCARLNGDYSVKQTEEHHILFGAGQRAISEENGLKVDLCIEHHRTGQQAVHNSREMRELLCKIAQTEFEKTHTRKEWERIARKNYL